jgi:hypothetical protein
LIITFVSLVSNDNKNLTRGFSILIEKHNFATTKRGEFFVHFYLVLFFIFLLLFVAGGIK